MFKKHTDSSGKIGLICADIVRIPYFYCPPFIIAILYTLPLIPKFILCPYFFLKL